MNKKYLILGGLALTVLSSFGAQKGYNITSVAGKLETGLKAIKNINFTATGVNMKIDVTIKNPTTKALDVSAGGAVTVKTINIYDKHGFLVATANPNIMAISIAPGGTVILEDVPVSSRYGDIINLVVSGASSDPDDYRVETVIESFGKEFII